MMRERASLAMLDYNKYYQKIDRGFVSEAIHKEMPALSRHWHWKYNGPVPGIYDGYMVMNEQGFSQGCGQGVHGAALAGAKMNSETREILKKDHSDHLLGTIMDDVTIGANETTLCSAITNVINRGAENGNLDLNRKKTIIIPLGVIYGGPIPEKPKNFPAGVTRISKNN
jgi:hypothetical protein